MSRLLVFRRKARRDILEAKAWYDALSLETGNDFAEEVEKALSAILDNPHQYQRVRGELRRALFVNFSVWPVLRRIRR